MNKLLAFIGLSYFLLIGANLPLEESLGVITDRDLIGTWTYTDQEKIPDMPGGLMTVSMTVIYSANHKSLARMTMSISNRGEVVPLAKVRITESWKIRSYNGKYYLEEELIECNTTFNRMPDDISPCKDVILMNDGIDNPAEILFVNDEQLILKEYDPTTGEYDVITLKK